MAGCAGGFPLKKYDDLHLIVVIIIIITITRAIIRGAKQSVETFACGGQQ